jgi:hypothetical protein
MAKRKKSKGGKRSRKSGGKRSRSKGAQAVLPEQSQLFTESGPSLTPAPALPTQNPSSTRERKTRGGKSTLSTHEFLTEVPTPTRPATSRPANSRPASSRPTPARPAPAPAPRARPAQNPPQKPAQKPAQQRAPQQTPRAPQRAPQHGPQHPLSQSQIYETLAALFVPYARKMESEMHPKIGFCLKVRSARTGRETHFGAVQALADGVAFHLFPLYAHPDLLEGLSPDLFNRMRGKTCFHFDSLDAGLVAELAQLTHAGFERFLSDGVF